MPNSLTLDDHRWIMAWLPWARLVVYRRRDLFWTDRQDERDAIAAWLLCEAVAIMRSTGTVAAEEHRGLCRVVFTHLVYQYLRRTRWLRRRDGHYVERWPGLHTTHLGDTTSPEQTLHYTDSWAVVFARIDWRLLLDRFCAAEKTPRGRARRRQLGAAAYAAYAVGGDRHQKRNFPHAPTAQRVYGTTSAASATSAIRRMCGEMRRIAREAAR